MRVITDIKKQTLSMKQKYYIYLNDGLIPANNKSNKHNIFDDLNDVDKVIMEETRIYMHLANKLKNNTV